MGRDYLSKSRCSLQAEILFRRRQKTSKKEKSLAGAATNSVISPTMLPIESRRSEELQLRKETSSTTPIFAAKQPLQIEQPIAASVKIFDIKFAQR